VFLAAFTPFLVSCAIAGIERMAAGAMSRHTLALIQASAATHMVAVSAAVALRLQRQRRMEERVRDTYTNRLETKVAIRTAELQQTSEHLAASNLQKDRLFSIIAHDLRGPLNGIVAAADRLARDPGSFSREETAAFAGDIRDAAVGLRQTLENLLAWARIQTNRFVLQPVRTSVPLLMRDLEPLFRVAARERALKLELRCEPTLEIVADYEGLKTILRNFLSNAIKVSPPGSSVTVEARVRDDAVVLSVFDEGPGMDAEGRGQLFQLSPGDRKPGTEERGAGIGLVLCAEIAARMGATIEVESAPGRGSVFRLWLASGRTQQEPVVRVRERPPAG
jgi:signal transduction histidine kinase